MALNYTDNLIPVTSLEDLGTVEVGDEDSKESILNCKYVLAKSSEGNAVLLDLETSLKDKLAYSYTNKPIGKNGALGDDAIMLHKATVQYLQKVQNEGSFSGTQGPQGTQGRIGLQGYRGYSIQGTQGPQGEKGPNGAISQGSQGTQGPTGTTSAPGSQGIQGISVSPPDIRDDESIIPVQSITDKEGRTLDDDIYEAIATTLGLDLTEFKSKGNIVFTTDVSLPGSTVIVSSGYNLYTRN